MHHHSSGESMLFGDARLLKGKHRAGLVEGSKRITLAYESGNLIVGFRETGNHLKNKTVNRDRSTYIF